LRFSKPGYIEQTAVVTPTSPSLVTVLLSETMSASPAERTKPGDKSRLDRMPGYNTNISGASGAQPGQLNRSNPYGTSVRSPSGNSPAPFEQTDRSGRTDRFNRTDRLDREDRNDPF
ncbi:MAG: hypothetical protein AAF449_21890, partial [Myxococcota bacterium]